MIILAESKIYETPAWGFEDQPAFLNMAIKGKTDLQPEPLLKYLKQLEARLGREPSFHWGPRLIDIDLLFYDELVLDTPQLVIPHPRLHERAFVLVPLADIAPDLVHPILVKPSVSCWKGWIKAASPASLVRGTFPLTHSQPDIIRAKS